MEQLDLEGRSAATARGPRVNWGVAITVVLAIVGWILAGIGDYRRIENRVTTLEAQRQGDSQRLDRMEDKIDRILERLR